MIDTLITSLKALEALVLRCPTEITPFLGSIIQIGNQYIKYDPVSSPPSRLAASCKYLSRIMQAMTMTRMKLLLLLMLLAELLAFWWAVSK